MTTPPPRPRPVLANRSDARVGMYQTLLEDSGAVDRIRLPPQLPGLSAETVRTTQYLLQRDHLVEELGGQRRLTFRLTEASTQALHAILNRWRATDATRSPTPGKAIVMTLPLTFHLGQAANGGRPWRIDDASASGHTFYLPRLEAVLTVEYRICDGWRCAVIARRRPRPDAHHVLLSQAETLAAPATVAVDVDDHDAVAMVWVAQVWRRWRGGLVHLGARTLAEDIRVPGTLVADVDLHALARIAEVTRLRSPGIRRLLDRLTTADLLTSVEPHADQVWGSYALRLPGWADAALAQPPRPSP